jgi:hypothetical protein
LVEWSTIHRDTDLDKTGALPLSEGRQPVPLAVFCRKCWPSYAEVQDPTSRLRLDQDFIRISTSNFHAASHNQARLRLNWDCLEGLAQNAWEIHTKSRSRVTDEF